MKTTIFAWLGSVLLVACQTLPTTSSLSYVSAGYQQQEQGADWVRVDITRKGQRADINIHSRADVKTRQTCQFTGSGQMTNPQQIEVALPTGKMLLNIAGTQLTISAADDANLHYYCSGGASLTGSYTKLAE